MFLIFKRSSAEDILHKHILKYILRVGLVFQMYQAKPAYHIGIQVYCPGRLLLAAHTGKNLPAMMAAVSLAMVAAAPAVAAAVPISVAPALALMVAVAAAIVIADAIAVAIHEIAFMVAVAAAVVVTDAIPVIVYEAALVVAVAIAVVVADTVSVAVHKGAGRACPPRLQAVAYPAHSPAVMGRCQSTGGGKREHQCRCGKSSRRR